MYYNKSYVNVVYLSKYLLVLYVQHGNTGQRDDSHPGRMEWHSWRSHHATQNGMQSKTYELFVSGVCHLIFLDHGRPQITETTES